MVDSPYLNYILLYILRFRDSLPTITIQTYLGLTTLPIYFNFRYLGLTTLSVYLYFVIWDSLPYRYIFIFTIWDSLPYRYIFILLFGTHYPTDIFSFLLFWDSLPYRYIFILYFVDITVILTINCKQNCINSSDVLVTE